MGSYGCLCYTQLLLILSGWVLRRAYRAESKVPSLITACFCKAVPWMYFFLDVDFSFSEILNLLSFLAALSFKPDFAVWEDVHLHGSRHILWAGGVFMWTVVGPLGFLLNSFSQSSISEL